MCKKGNSDITVHQSDTNTEYTLISLPYHTVISSANGTGGDITLNTGTITDSTKYLISAKSIFADCEVFIGDTIIIGVEKTKAIFHPHLIYASTYQNIHFFNNSKQASTYQWDFGNGASLSTSTAFEPSLSYNQLGATQINLIATSQCGCKDTLEESGPFIYNPAPNADNCWALNFDGDDIGTYGHDRGEEIKIANNGDIIVSGSYSDCEFLTKVGQTKGKQDNSGFYIARYTSHGVLKWLVRAIDRNTSGNIQLANYSRTGSAFDLAIDSEDNIYVTGWLDQDFLLYANNGNSIPLNNYDEGFILKLDSNGTFQWYTGIDNGVGFMIGLDDSSNIYVGGHYHHTAKFYSVSDTFQQKTTFWYGENFVLKLNSSGELKWVTDFNSTNAHNNYALEDIGY